jgi:predicted GNAT family acetyltransferase
MTLPLWSPVSTSITWRNGIRFLLRVTPVSRIAYWTSVPVSQAWNFHPDHHCSTINLVSTNNTWRNEGEIERTQLWASLEELEVLLQRTYWRR